ncbi:UDP-glucose 4-epimerase GalE [Christensenellaceae bacterium OttesenSCG-928-K19]|nr:UDP-glucose 4-epimerase GalE [Christensenellaceae bacterium OttesenSCG-928-K19]
MKILVTGGAGFIGSHTCVELLEAGHDIVVVDNLVNSSRKAIEAVQGITGRKFPFYEYDLLDKAACKEIFEQNTIDAVIHFAGLKAVGESVEKPLLYYRNNLGSTLNLLELMRDYSVNSIVFSSSATVYGAEASIPYVESMPRGKATSPYGASKQMIEQMLEDQVVAEAGFSAVLLRYFNPIGAHESGEIGEDPNGIPNNLLPYVAQVASGKLEQIGVFGNDYPTRDGTGVRDYIHVTDLARGHVVALEKKAAQPGVHLYNLGAGRGYSVLEVVDAFSTAVGRKLPYKIMPRRAGDLPEYYADPVKAKNELGWQSEYDIGRMCADTWRWQQKHPNGFEEE